MTDNNNNNKYCINFAHVQAAAQRIQGTAHVTPVLTSTSLNHRLADGGQCRVFFKVEALQKTGSFKFRGALNAVRTILEEQKEQAKHNNNNNNNTTALASTAPIQVLTHSSGNHAQALALAAQLSSTSISAVTATIVMPQNTPAVKKQAVADFGATIVTVESTNQARQAKAHQIQQETGAIFIHPSEDVRVIAGQGTVCLEMIQQIQDQFGYDTNLDVVIIPVGGGGLASGNIITLRALLGNKVKIVLAEPAVLDDAKRSFQVQQLLGHEPDNALDSVADGLKTTLGPHTWPIIRDEADAIITVSEVDILKATQLVWERLKICIEPSAGVGVAVLLSDEFAQQFETTTATPLNIGVILCGGNVDVVKISQKMQEYGL